MTFSFVFWGLCAIYLLGWLLYGLSFFKIRQKAYSWAERVLALGLCLQLIWIAASYYLLGEFLFDSVSGLMLFLSLLLMGLYFILNRFFPNQIFGVIFPPLTIFFLLLSVLISDHPIISHSFLEKSPVFGKLILYIHASFSMLGYLLFGIACLASMFFLYQERRIKKKTLPLTDGNVPSLGFLGTLIFRVIVAGFLFLTVGLLVGISMTIVASEGMPQTSLRQLLPGITWGVYALFLIDRSISGLRGRASAIWAIIGFVVAVSSFIYEVRLLIGKG